MIKFEKIILVFILTCTFLHAEDYTFGDGLQLGDSPIILGGYISTVYESKKHSRQVDIDDIALLAYGEYDHFDFLAEFETADLYKKEFGDHPDESSSTTIHTERFFGDYYFSDNERVRLGKFNSDIGFWNQMPINVLRDTTASPHLVKDFFPKLSTGINYEMTQVSDTINRVSLTLQNNHNLDIGYNNFNTNRHYSAACDIVDHDATWRFSGGYFRVEPDLEAMYFLGALKIKKKEGNFLLESVLRRDIQKEEYSYDIYAEGVWHIIAKHDVILGAEVEKAPLTQIHDGTIALGYTYRPLSNIALKGGYEAHQESDLNRWLFSLSVLF
jgi:hypothetical protein